MTAITLRRALVLGGLTVVITLTTVLTVAQATPPSRQVVETLARGTTADTHLLRARGTLPNQKAGPWRGAYETPWDLVTVRVTLPPGANTGWHRHPGPGFMAVTQGAVTVLGNDCTRKTYTAGQAYVEVPGHANIVRNDGTATAVFVGTCVLRSTATLRLDVPTAPCAG